MTTVLAHLSRIVFIFFKKMRGIWHMPCND
jgi:hypothetical protein